MEHNHKIPATVVTGFLGAGKTTLIRHLLSNAGGRRIALIVNEFGDVGVDGELLKACGNATCTEDDIVELANGCICCTVAEDFIPTMEKLLARDVPPDYIVIETSGLALPQPLVRAFNWPQIKTRVTVDGVVTLVDAAAMAEGRFAANEKAVQAQRLSDDALDHETPLGELFADQLTCADLVVLSKSDLLEDGVLAKMTSRVQDGARPGVPVVTAAHGALAPEVLIGLEARAENDNRLSHHEAEHAAAGEQGLDHLHDHNDFESFAVTLDEIDDKEVFKSIIQYVVGANDILRVKGFAAVAEKPMRLVVQAVGPRIETYFDRDWLADEPRQTRLIVIGRAGLDQQAIERALQDQPVAPVASPMPLNL